MIHDTGKLFNEIFMSRSISHNINKGLQSNLQVFNFAYNPKVIKLMFKYKAMGLKLISIKLSILC